MRIRDLVEGLDLGYQRALPHGDVYPDITNHYYDMYRMGIAMAGHPDNHHDTPKTTEVGNNLFTLQFSDAERQIIDSAAKQMGHKKKKVAKGKSSEPHDIGTASPVAQWMKPTKGKAK